MGGVTKLLVDFSSMEVSNLLECMRSGVMGWILFLTLGLQIASAGGTVVVLLGPMQILVPVLSLKYGVEVLIIPLWIGMEIGMYTSTPVLVIQCVVLFFHALSNITSVKISCTAGISSICGASSITSTIGFVSRGKTETSTMVQKLNHFWSKIPLLVWVTVSRLLVRSPCASCVVAVFKSYTLRV